MKVSDRKHNINSIVELQCAFPWTKLMPRLQTQGWGTSPVWTMMRGWWTRGGRGTGDDDDDDDDDDVMMM